MEMRSSATGFFPLLALASLEVPPGWTAMPRASLGGLQPPGNPAPVATSTPLRVTVPNSATDGHHMITANLIAAGLRFTTQADVLIAHGIDFDTGTVDENPWLFDAGGSQSNGVQNRFADGNAHFTYRFPFPADTTSAHVTLTIDAEYLVQASSDGEHWTTVLAETRPITDGSNKGDQTIDLTPFLATGAD